ncbi:MAG TPA: hypothetical protein VGJ13_07785 [Pseudonocardiaceae bacterium]|jgi:hypothetical protein
MTEKRRPGRPATGQKPNYPIRVDREVQDAFVAAAGKEHPAVVAAFMAWYARLPGSRRPERPPAAGPEPEFGG